MHKWYVVQVFTTHEKKIRKALEEQRGNDAGKCIEEVLIPIENVSEVKNGVQRIVEKKLWPGYILIKMELNDESWSLVKNTSGVIDFLGGSKPEAMTDYEVREILDDLRNKKETVTQRHKFEVGDRVKITDGVFVNFIGTITDVFHDKGRVNVMLSIFGRDTQVDDLEFFQIEEITEEEKAQ